MFRTSLFAAVATIAALSVTACGSEQAEVSWVDEVEEVKTETVTATPPAQKKKKTTAVQEVAELGYVE